MDVDPATVKKPAPGSPRNPSLSPRATVYARCETQGKKYRLEFDVIGDSFKPAKGKSDPGTVRIRLIGPLGPPISKPQVQEAVTVEGTRVRNLVYWPEPGRRPNMSLGGAVAAPGLAGPARRP